MKDLIAKLHSNAADQILATFSTLEMQLQGFAKSSYEKDLRIAELEAQIAAKPADTDKLRDTLDKMHNDIMNLPCKPYPKYSDVELKAYKYGHKDARHSAAELVGSTALQAPVREVPGWQPIETAPYHKPILLWWRTCKTPSIGQWHSDGDSLGEDREGWRCDGDQCIPTNQEDCTHWMPLPAAPVQPEGE